MRYRFRKGMPQIGRFPRQDIKEAIHACACARGSVDDSLGRGRAIGSAGVHLMTGCLLFQILLRSISFSRFKAHNLSSRSRTTAMPVRFMPK